MEIHSKQELKFFISADRMMIMACLNSLYVRI